MLAKKYKSEIISISNPFDDIYTLKFKSMEKKFKYPVKKSSYIKMKEILKVGLKIWLKLPYRNLFTKCITKLATFLLLVVHRAL